MNFKFLQGSSSNVRPTASSLLRHQSVKASLSLSPSLTLKPLGTPQKIFRVTGSRENVSQWMNCKNLAKSKFTCEDHDYVFRGTAAYSRIIPKEPLNYQAPSTNEQSVTAATRKSTLRKGRVFQERLVLLQWRQNYVEIIFANTSRKNALTTRVSSNVENILC